MPYAAQVAKRPFDRAELCSGDSGGPPGDNATAVIADRLPAIVLVGPQGTVSGVVCDVAVGPRLPDSVLGIGCGRLALVPTSCIMGLAGTVVLSTRAVKEAGMITIRCTRKLMTTMIVAGDKS